MKNQCAFAIVPVDLFELRLKQSTFIVFTALASFAGKSRVVWPSVRTLAEMVDMQERSVRRCIGELEEAGAISRVPRFDEDGRQMSNAYRLDVLVSHGAARSAPAGTPGSGPAVGEEGDSGVSQTLPVGTLPEEQTTQTRARERKSEREESLSAEEEFNEWYQHYPRRVARGQAERTFARVRCEGASLEALIAGAKRYARQVAGKEARFIRYPATWLNGKCWLDEDAPAAAAADGELTWWQKSKRAAERMKQQGENIGA